MLTIKIQLSHGIEIIENTSQEQTQRDTGDSAESTEDETESRSSVSSSIVVEFVQSLLQELLSSDGQDPESIKLTSSTTISISLKKLANLFYQANTARENSIKAKRKEISFWGCYSERFEDKVMKVMELRSGEKDLKDKTARGQIYETVPYRRFQWVFACNDLQGKKNQ